MSPSLESDLKKMFDLQTRELGLSDPPESNVVRLTANSSRRNSSLRLRSSVAAAMVLLLGGGATLWAMSARGDAPSTNRSGRLLVPTDPPLLVLDAPSWELTGFNDFDPSVSGDRATTFIDPSKGVAGPRVTVVVSDGRGSTALPVEEQAVTIGVAPGRLYVDGDDTLVHWTQPDGLTLEAFGRFVGPDDLVAVASAISVDGNGFAAATGPLPANLVAMTGRDAELMRRSVEYSWAGRDGRVLQVSLNPVGQVFACCGGGPGGRRIEFQGFEAMAYADQGTFTLTQQRGFWALKIQGYASPESPGATSYADLDEFVSAANLVHETNTEAWSRSLPADIVLRSDRATVVAELNVWPMPAGIPAVTVPDDGLTARRGELASHIAHKAACAWSAELATAVSAANIAASTTAAQTLVQLAAWSEIADVPDVIQGTDGALTEVGQVRRSAEAVQPFVTSGPEVVGLDRIPLAEIQSTLICAR